MPNETNDMQTAQLGASGLKVSRFALGTMTFAAETERDEAFKQLDVFVERGGTFIDTADAYANGASEQIIGDWGKARGGLDDLVIATKGRFNPPKGSTGASRRGLTKAVDASLSRLQVEAIDLYFVHGWDKDVPVLETLQTLTDVVAAGKIHHIAWSNVTGWQLQKIISTAEAHGLVKPVALQPQYNPLDRAIEWEVMPCAMENGLSLTPWSPLGGGWLTGKYSAQKQPEGATRLGEDPQRGVEAYDKRNTERTYAILEVVADIASSHGRPMSHVALQWLLSRPSVSSILLGARTVAQLEDNLNAVDLVLSESDLAQLTEVSKPGVPEYPYAMLEKYCGMEVWEQLGT
ncbi:MAG: aldo/keto reductase [Pseudomonadota bacterium]